MDNTINTGEGQESTDNYQLSIASCPLKRIALFPGTFDPFTIGHESLVSRGLELVDEIIIVDTGSKDHTKEIAAKYTEKIYDFPWVDDFAAARNQAFAQAN